MRIRALRVAECGRFETPTAIEGLTGGLDVLVGPNELGKSTLLRALRAALFEKHTTRKAEIEALRPYGGGAPLIEVDLEIGGETWRLRKRFLAERMAELTSLAGGSVARGADAEAALERLVGAGEGAGRFGLLWLDQGGTLAPPDPGKDGQEALRGAIQREVASAAGGERARRVHERVRAALGELVTAGRGQKRGRYQAAQRQLEVHMASLAKAQQSRAAAEEMLARLGRLEALGREIGEGEARAGRARRVLEAEARLAAAREGIAGRDRARGLVAEARAVHASAAEAARDLAARLADVERLEIEAAGDAAAAQTLGARQAAAATELEAITTEAGAARQGLAAAEAELAQSRSAVRRLELSERHRRAVAAGDRARELGRMLAGLPRGEDGVREARRLSAGIGEATARLEAQSAVLSVAYEPGAAGRIRIGGRPLDDGERVIADAPLVLVIEGIGRIMLQPGAAADIDKLRSALAEDRRRLAELLAEAEVSDLAGLEAGCEAARRIAGELAEAEAQLAVLAPDGPGPLAAELADLDRETPSDGAPAQRRPANEVEADLVRRKTSIAALEHGLAEARARRDQLDRDEAVRAARGGERARRLAEVEAALPPAPERGLRLAALEDAAVVASRAFDEALRTFSAWESRAPDTAGLAGLDAEVVAAREAVRRGEQEAAALAAERARIEGALAAAQGEDVEGAAAALEAEAERARAELAEIAEEVGALQLLDAELAGEEARLGSLYVGPVTSRMAPYLETVFPGAGIDLGTGYSVTGVARGGRSEPLAQLSDGTREQIAVIVRLGFGRLLADQGVGVPLVLDDALVYSDDERIKAMHRALEMAAMVHQVIVLTCRAQSFAGLGGHRVTLEPWANVRAR